MKTIYTGSDHLSSQGHSMEYSLNKDYGYGAWDLKLVLLLRSSEKVGV